MRDKADREVLDGLLDKADVMVDNFRPGVLDKLSLDWATLHRRWPRLVCCSISGFGATGPFRSNAAFDVIAQAEGGMMALSGFEGMAPCGLGAPCR